jgi:hypothetical protein
LFDLTPKISLYFKKNKMTNDYEENEMKKVAIILMIVGVFLLGLSATAFAQGGVGYSVQSDGDDQLYSIDLTTGTATAIGPVGFTDVEGLSFHPFTGVLYGVDDDTDQLITIDLDTGAGTAVGPLNVVFTDMGLTFDRSGRLWMSTDIPEDFYSINTDTGAATAIGNQGQDVTGLACSDYGIIYGLGGDGTDNLVTVNTATGVATSVGPLINVSGVSDGGIDFDAIGTLWGLEDTGTIFTINPMTGEATVVATTLTGFEGFAIPRGWIVGGEILSVDTLTLILPYVLFGALAIAGTVGILLKKKRL